MDGGGLPRLARARAEAVGLNTLPSHPLRRRQVFTNCSDTVVEIDRRIVKAKLLAGGFFRANSLNEETARVKGHLSVLSRPLVEGAVRELVETHSPIFWEVTDRQVNIDYVDEERRRQIQVLAASVEFASDTAPAAKKG